MLDDLINAKEKHEQYNEVEAMPVCFEDGYPATASGQMLAFPEIYFLGLRWLVSAASATLFGAPYDAAIIATKIARMRGYPHQNMIAPHFLDPRIREEDMWNVPEEEFDRHDSASEDEGEFEQAALDEQKKYFPYADPTPLENVAEADILPPKPKKLSLDDPLPSRYIVEKPKRYKSRNLTEAELQRQVRNQELMAKGGTPRTVRELQEMMDNEQQQAMMEDSKPKDDFERWQPKLSRKQFRESKQGIDPYAANFGAQEKAMILAAQKRMKKKMPKDKYEKSNGQVFPLTQAMLNSLVEDDAPIRVVRDHSKKTKQGVRGTIEQYIQGHRGLKDVRKGKSPRK